MNGKRMFRLWMVTAALFAVCSAIEAATPWGSLLALKGVDADPEQTYPLTERNGPWMIMACTFVGDGAAKQAQQLVHELRKRYKLPAYMYQAQMDIGEAEGRGIDKYGNPRKFIYAQFKDKAKPEVKEIAVMVGNFRAADDPDAQETLRKLKYAQPQALELKEGQVTHQTLTGWRLIQRQVYKAIGSEKEKLGPMQHAFVTTNPLLPAEYFTAKGIDPTIIALNKDVPYSLLDCPGKYTVQVATFKGKVIIKQEEIRDIQNGNKEMDSELGQAAEKADKLTRALRMNGYEAYQFHDRYASIVTIGSFESVGTPRPDGKIEINPTVHRIMEVFGADKELGAKLGTVKPQGSEQLPLQMPVKFFVGIPLDIQPIPVVTPKRPISAAINRSEE
jgi:hypothetical protein